MVRILSPLRRFPVLLIILPAKIRLVIILLSFLICQVLYIIIYPLTQNAVMVVIPVTLAAWFFRYRGMFLCLAVTALAMELVSAFLFHLPFWSLSSRLLALTGLGALLTIGLIVAYLRSTVDLVEAARCRLQQGEQQLLIAYEQQQQLIHQKELFLMHVNHELRNPLTTIYGSLQVLRQNKDGQDPFPDAFQMSCLNRALGSCEHLILLVNQVLQATTVSRGVISPCSEEVSIAQVVQDLLEHGDPRIGQSCQLSLHIPEQVKVWTDRQFLELILWNLLSNASKYCPPQTLVLIRSTSYDHTPPMICTRVKDSGPGIPPDEIPHLFAPFVRLKRDISMSIPGSGLGLYISKQMVEAMGGHIWIESSGVAGEGSCFCFTLPAATPGNGS
jgi:signal transduction histidine kinase